MKRSRFNEFMRTCACRCWICAKAWDLDDPWVEPLAERKSRVSFREQVTEIRTVNNY